MGNRQPLRKHEDRQSLTLSAPHRHDQEAASLALADTPTASALQLAPDKTMFRSARQNAILQMQQRYGNRYVNRMLEAKSGRTPQPGMAGNRVSRLRNTGAVLSYRAFDFEGNPDEHYNRDVQIRARTTDEWIKFLKDDADSGWGTEELYGFMVAAVGHPYNDDEVLKSRESLDSGQKARDESLKNCYEAQKLQQAKERAGFPGTKPSPLRLCSTSLGPVTQQEAVDLMIAFLKVGSDIDLPDKQFEGSDTGITLHVARAMSEFNAKYAGPALQQMTSTQGNGSREFDSSDVGNIAEYAHDASKMEQVGKFAGDKFGVNPVESLIAASVGTAFGAAVQVLQAGSDKQQQDFKHNAYTLLRNAAMTIRGSLDAAEADEARNTAILVTAFSGAANALAAASGYGAVVYQIGAWGLSGVAAAYFPNLVAGDGKKATRKLKDDFHKQLNDAKTVKTADGTEKPIESASDIETIKTVFDTVLNY